MHSEDCGNSPHHFILCSAHYSYTLRKPGPWKTCPEGLSQVSGVGNGVEGVFQVSKCPQRLWCVWGVGRSTWPTQGRDQRVKLSSVICKETNAQREGTLLKSHIYQSQATVSGLNPILLLSNDLFFPCNPFLLPIRPTKWSPRECPGIQAHSHQWLTGIQTNQAQVLALKDCSTASSTTSLSMSQGWN